MAARPITTVMENNTWSDQIRHHIPSKDSSRLGEQTAVDALQVQAQYQLTLPAVLTFGKLTGLMTEGANLILKARHSSA